MSAKRKEFIVLALGDKASYGYDENTLPTLLQLVDASAPDARIFTHAVIVAYYLRSRRAVLAVEKIVSQAESFRETDKRFTTLGIGLAYGHLIADFDWLGRLKPNSIPIGEVVGKASSGIQSEQKHGEILKQLHESIS